MFSFNEDRYARAAVLVGVISVSFAAIFVRWCEAPPLIIAMYRLLFAAMLTLGVIGCRGKGFSKIDTKDALWSGVAGTFLAMHFYAWFTSLQLTSVASSTVLVTMQPIFVFLGGYIFLREKIDFTQAIAVAVAISGSFLIAGADWQSGNGLSGDMLALLGALLVAVYFILGRKLRVKLPVLEYTFLVYLSSAFILAFLAVLLKVPFYPYPLNTWLMFFLLALVPTMLGHSLFNWALKHLETKHISISILGEPVGAAALAALFFKEMPTLWEASGGILILTGLYLFHRKKYEA